MMDTKQIREHMEVVGSCGSHVGTVDHMDGKSIKLTQSDVNAGGEHHWLPVELVDKVDEKVRLKCNHMDAMNKWTTSPTSA